MKERLITLFLCGTGREEGTRFGLVWFGRCKCRVGSRVGVESPRRDAADKERIVLEIQ